MFKVLVDYPSYEDELAIAEATTSTDMATLQPMLDRDDIMHLQKIVRKVLVGHSVASYAGHVGRPRERLD
jgi:MoxR-like ATPase